MNITKKTDWKRISDISSKKKCFSSNLQFTDKEMQIIKNGFIPSSMEDHWFAYFENNNLYLHRSWSGYCIFIVSFQKTDNYFKAYQITACRDKKIYNYQSNKTDEQLVGSIIKNSILN